MSIETEDVRRLLATGKLAEAVDLCNGLAMFDILPTVLGLTPAERFQLASDGVRVLGARGWSGSAERLRWACETVELGAIPSWRPADLPPEQVDDARRFFRDGLGRLLHLRALMDSGRLTFDQSSDRRELEGLIAGASVSNRPSAGLARLLATLGDAQPTNMLSLFRPNQGPHGVVAGGGFVSRAVDVNRFGGLGVTLSDPALAITVVTNVIRLLPPGVYKIGFPRPVGGKTGLDPAHDVFFPVPDLATAQRCWDATISLPLGAMLNPAQGAVRAAIPAGVTFDALFPDGLDHLHIEARSNTAPISP